MLLLYIYNSKFFPSVLHIGICLMIRCGDGTMWRNSVRLKTPALYSFFLTPVLWLNPLLDGIPFENNQQKREGVLIFFYTSRCHQCPA